MAVDMLIIDFDSHYLETKDAFTRYIGEEYAVKSVKFENGPRNQNYLYINGKRSVQLPSYNPPLDTDAGTEDFYAALEMGKIESSGPDHDDGRPLPDYFSTMPRAWCDRAPRLELMDRQGVHASIMLPTVGVSVEPELEGEVDLAHAVHRAFNRWLEEHWGFAHAGRIFAIPQMRLYDIDQAMDELEWLISKGARGVNLPLGPVWGPGGARYSPADTRFDRFWSRVVEADLFVTLHLSLTEYYARTAEVWGEAARSRSGALHEMPGFTAWAAGDRAILETVGSMLLFNLFERHPGLRVVSVENGGGAWLEYLLQSVNKGYRAPPFAPWPGGKPSVPPAETARKHLHVVPYPEDSIPRVVELLGEDSVMFGSDYPHPEGLPSPMHMMKRLQGLNDQQVRKVMGVNAANMLKISELDQRRLLSVTTAQTVEEAMLARAS